MIRYRLGPLLVVLGICWMGQTARADEPAIARTLDQPLQAMTIAEQELPAAVEVLAQRAGVNITVNESSADLLPWGRHTRIKNLTIPAGTTLREALSHVLSALGMTYEVTDSGIEIVATEPLKRIARRATWDDLRLLRELNETEYSAEAMANVKIQYRITSKVDAAGLLAAQLAKSGRGTIGQMLEVATGALGWVWFPNGDHVAIRTIEAQIANRMARRVTIKYANEPLSKILIDLAERAETPIDFEPGMMLKLPQHIAQGTSVLLNQSSIRQAFELLQAETGIKYEIRRTGIWVGLSEEMRDAAAGAGIGTPVRVGGSLIRIVIPSSDNSFTYEVLIRPEELPDDLKEYRRQILEEYIQKLRAEMAPKDEKHSPGGTGQ